jgi:tetratricopeptide (TPR) repeat protein
MTRREFMAAVAAAAFVPARRAGAATVFPVHFRRANPYDSALQYLNPGSDEFKDEKAAAEFEARMRRIFAGQEAAPEGLSDWLSGAKQVRTARFYVLPGNRMRFEITYVVSGVTHHQTGVWSLPEFRVLESSAISSAEPYFRDVTGHVFGATDSFRKQLIPGNPHWRAQIDSAAGIDVYGNQGISVGDIDNDGADEIYVCQPGGLPNRLYKIHADGTSEDITLRSGLGILDETTCALFADFRNSGNQDAVLLCANGPLLFLNRGDGTFVEEPDAFHFNSPPQGSFTGMAAADYDRDGRLDLYLCCYVYFQSEDQYQFPSPYHDAQNGPPNFLFQNRAAGKNGIHFIDVTEQTGINQNNDRFSFAPAWCDFDGDGWPDLYVANDFGRNNFYRNREGKFSDEAAAAGVQDIGPGMSASWFDYDGDGRPDLYVSNMWTAAGQRVIQDAAFKPAKGNEDAYRRHTKGNSLYRNSGNGNFVETSRPQGVETGRWAWGSGGVDFDLDGSPEIFISTGMVTNGGSADLESFFWRQVVAKSPKTQKPAPEYENAWSAINQLIREDYSWSGNQPNVFYVRRDGKFVDASGVSGLEFAEDTRSFAVTDFDADGYPDIILKSRLGPQVRAMQNNAGAAQRISILLRGTESNRDAIGARIEINGQTQWLSAGSGFLSQHSKRLHFGLAGKPAGDARIFWPSGARQQLAGLEPGYAYVITEGEAHARRTPLQARRNFPPGAMSGSNAAEYGDSWLLEPAPLPDQRRRGFLLLHADGRPAFPVGLPVEFVDVTAEGGELAAIYALFHRYLFEYRGEFKLPLLMLVDDASCARRIYASIPSAKKLREDLSNIDRFAELALPFPGRYYKGTRRRNYFKFAAALYWAGYPQAAVPYLERAAKREQLNWKASLALARLLEETGRHQEALAAFKNVLAVRADYPPALVGAGEALVKVNDTSTARDMFQRAIAVDPKCADAANQLGILAAESSDFNGARDWFERAISIERDNAGAINNLGVLYAKMGKLDDAIAAFRYGIEVAPEDESLYMNLGRVYITLGRRDQARALMEQLLERKPADETARKALAELETR